MLQTVPRARDGKMPVSATEIRRFFERAAQGFDQAAASRGETTHHLTIADRTIRLRIAGNSLAHLARPLAASRNGCGRH